MLKITLGGNVIDLLDHQLSIVQTSPYPLVASGTAGGNYIFNFSLPATDELKRSFKFYHRPQSKDHSAEIPFRIDAEGLVFEGIAKVTEATSKVYEVFCPVGNGDFNKAAKEIKLNEIDLGGDRPILFTLANSRAALKEHVSYSAMASSEPFEEIMVPEFSNILRNDGGCFDSSGRRFVINNPKGDLELVLSLNATITYGYFAFRLFLNGSLLSEIVLDSNVTETILIPKADSITITWELFVQNSDSINQGLYDLDGVIDNSSEIRIIEQGIGTGFNPELKYPDIDFALFPVENPKVFENWDDDFYSLDNVSLKVLYNDYFKVINYYNGEFPQSLYGQLNGDSFMGGNIITPFPFVAYLIKRIAYHFNLRIENNPFESELKYLVLINHFCENEFLTDDAKLISAKEGFNLRDHVPDMTVYDFLKNICNLLGLGFEVNNQKKVLTFNYLEDIMLSDDYEDISRLVIDDLQVCDQDVTGVKLKLKFPSSDKYFSGVKPLSGANFKGIVGTYFDLPAGAALNDCYFVNLLDGYYVWKYNPDTYSFGWVLHSKNYILEKEIGVDVKEISPEIVPVMMKSPDFHDTVIGAPVDRQWLIPASHQPGQFEGAPETFQTKWQPLLCYYHGMFPCYPSGSYPFGSPDTKDLWGNPIPGVELSLRLDGENGLYEKKWKRYLEWRINARTVKAKIIPDRLFLHDLKFSKKKMINGVKYLLTEYRGNITKNGPGIAELTLLPL